MEFLYWFKDFLALVLDWPVLASIIGLVALKKVPDIIGSAQYKHLAILTCIKDTIFMLTDVIRASSSEQEDGRTSYNYEKIYIQLVEQRLPDKLQNTCAQFTAYCPQLREFKFTKFNKHAKTEDSRKEQVEQYINYVNKFIQMIAASEHFNSRETLRFYLNTFMQAASGIINKGTGK